MFRWKRERRAGVIVYRLYLFDNRTQLFIMREHGKSGNWVGRSGAVVICQDKLLGQVKASLEMLLEVVFCYELARKQMDRAFEMTSKAWFGKVGRQRADNEVGSACNYILELEDELCTILGIKPASHPCWSIRRVMSIAAFRIRDTVASLGCTFVEGE